MYIKQKLRMLFCFANRLKNKKKSLNDEPDQFDDDEHENAV